MFADIAQSESSHMASVKLFLDRCGLTDPAATDTAGKFQNSELQRLYDTLVAQGSRSLDEATEVGATIEDLDIRDLMNLIATSDNADLRVVYQNLLKGSRNHLRSFAGRLRDWRTGYTPRYISVELYRKIMASDRETGTLVTDPDYRFWLVRSAARRSSALPFAPYSKQHAPSLPRLQAIVDCAYPVRQRGVPSVNARKKPILSVPRWCHRSSCSASRLSAG